MGWDAIIAIALFVVAVVVLRNYAGDR